MRRDTQETRTKLIEAAEQLFAGRGIDGVSLADINQRAGQKNRNAVHYHFGDKESLIHAVLDKHSEGIESRRRELLDDAGESPALRQLVRALVIPVAEKLGDSDGGVAYLKINGQLMASDSYAEVRLKRVRHMDQAQRMSRLFERLLKNDRPGDLSARLLLVDCMLFQGLASYASRRPSVPRDAFVAILIGSILGVLSPPNAEEQKP
jgi:AcrR family transcriptional regulator